MFVFKQCECGSTDFNDDEDESTYRCTECGKLARIIYKEIEKTEDETND